MGFELNLDLDAGVLPYIPLAPLTTFRVGGMAQWFAEPHSVQDLERILAWCRRQGEPVTVLGAGSNLLISDSGIPGMVLSTRKLRGLQTLGEGRLWAAAGEPLVRLARAAADQGWSGMEWAIGIPGTVGGALAMNAGAHGRSTADVLVEATLLDGALDHQTLSREGFQFSYRFSQVQCQPWIVTGAVFQLQPGFDPQAIRGKTEANWEQRRRSQPYDLPSCGSVFRNPEAYPAGWLIEQTGLKGYRIGDAQVAHRHANFILNCGHAQATDIYRLIRLIQEEVFQRWSVLLEPEVRVLGEFPAQPLERILSA